MNTEILELSESSRWDYRITVTSPHTHIVEQCFICGGMSVAEDYAAAARARMLRLIDRSRP